MVANEAVVATLLLILSELLGSIPAFKSNGILSFLLLQAKEWSSRRGAVDPTPED
ncbi:MAG: hypothetical protein HWN81_22910 [Candidatus Lokiarchaeota archaeon]|nr:hypothetical protein [Candidatus Lokiarchaeota archaeon]